MIFIPPNKYLILYTTGHVIDGIQPMNWTNIPYLFDGNDSTYGYCLHDVNSLYADKSFWTGQEYWEDIYSPIIEKVEIGIKSHNVAGEFFPLDYLGEGVENCTLSVSYDNGVDGFPDTYYQGPGQTIITYREIGVNYIDITNGANAPAIWTWDDISNLDFKHQHKEIDLASFLNVRIYWVAVVVSVFIHRLKYHNNDETSSIYLYDNADQRWENAYGCGTSDKQVYGQLDSNVSHANATDLRTRIGDTTYAFISPSGAPS